MTTAVTTARARAARIWFGGIAVVVGAALVIQLVLVFTNGQDVNSFQPTTSQSLGERLINLFSYFTIQSNLFVLGTSIALAVSIGRDGRVWRVVRLDALLGIIITGLVYDFVLAGLVHPAGWALAATIGFHYISPWATLLGWLIFGPRPRMSWRVMALAFLWPLAWLVLTFVRGALTGWYPYPFLDVDLIGLADSLRNSAVILLVAVAIAAILTLLDKHLPALVHDRRSR
ncbi:Pr6Pr family membrane protein [Herbiconiux sp. CPCC 203407]|uniref:Pr6Pr family membrane protein n=1 Tax=Herbiconiux oxytropis TaxID=2970915 RepID=A0AA41XJH8_9MICO|nr:Pr6Pr family membrane protein [Herbiconiux oxytropis]MCS5721804.1 Pr6Pr family membrane protein [Herbiconiux oxytropis]MCS5727330.1 Pr6Pr family membrane protein [Herbiconiux oxytropis]